MTKFLKRFFVIISDVINGGTNKLIAKHLEEIEERTKEFDKTAEDIRNKIEAMKKEMRRDISSAENSIHVLKEKVINMTPKNSGVTGSAVMRSESSASVNLKY